MKKHFTFGIFLFLLLGVGSNVSANLIKSAGTPVVGLDWSSTAAWIGGVVPTSADSVLIQAGDSITTLLGSASCQTITVNGKLMVKSYTLYANGDVIVNRGGTFNLDKFVYCKNIKNFGKFYAPGRSNSGTSTYVYLGYGSSGITATASTDSCTIVNDSIFGWYKTPSLSGSNGCGFIVFYSNVAKAVTVTSSKAVTPGCVFNINSMLPAVTGLTPSQKLNVYIKKSVGFVSTSSSYPGLALQNNDAFAYPRTCTIFAGDTLFVAGYFPYKTSAPTANQSSITYNIYGCIDLASYNRSKNELDMYTSAASDSIILNVKNGGALIFGKVITINQSVAGQTTAINTEPGSNVKFGYTASAPTITLTNGTFPASLYNLEIATGGNIVTLPASLRVKNALTLTSGKVTLGNYNLTAASLTGGSATSYAITSGTGALTLNAATSGTLFPIGTATGYAPVTITPESNDTVSALVSSIATGSYTGYAINANEWTLTPQVATTAALAFTPTAAANTTSPVIFSGSGYAAKADATVAGSTYSASGFSLVTTATIFATGGTTPPTALKSTTNNDLLVYADNNSLVVRNAKVGDVVSVYAVSGLKVASSVVKGNNVTMTLKPGVYFVKAGSSVQKVILQ